MVCLCLKFGGRAVNDSVLRMRYLVRGWVTGSAGSYENLGECRSESEWFVATQAVVVRSICLWCERRSY